MKNTFYILISVLTSPYNISFLSFIFLGGNLFLPFIFFFLFPYIVSLPYIKNFNIRLHTRSKVILVVALFYLIGSLLMDGNQKFLGLCYFLNAIISLVITQKYKISLHAIGVSTSATAIYFISEQIYSVLLFLLIIPIWVSRKKLHAHTNTQLFLGILVGIVFTLLWKAVIL